MILPDIEDYLAKSLSWCYKTFMSETLQNCELKKKVTKIERKVLVNLHKVYELPKKSP